VFDEREDPYILGLFFICELGSGEDENCTGRGTRGEFGRVSDLVDVIRGDRCGVHDNKDANDTVTIVASVNWACIILFGFVLLLRQAVLKMQLDVNDYSDSGKHARRIEGI